MTRVLLLHDLLDEAARRFAGQPAVATADSMLTYQAVAARSERLAAWLASRGVRHGDRVVLALPASPLIPALLFGSSRAGAAFVLLHEETPAAVAAHVLDDAHPVLVLTDSPVLGGLAAQRGIAHHGLDDVQAAAIAPATGPLPAPPTGVDPACFIYTSGSTALPKAVVCTHLAMTFAAAAIQSQLRYRPQDTVFTALPLSFDYGLYQVFLAALSGARLYLSPAGAAGPGLVTELARSAATVLPAVPAMAVNLVRLLDRRPAALPRLRLLTNTGAAMPPALTEALRDKLPGLHVQLMYGLTECKRATIMPPDEDLRRPGACGRALPGTEVFTVDSNGTRLPAGETGEVVVRGPHVMAGYWQHRDLTRQRFRLAGNGLTRQLHTGDYGWMDDDGYLYFSGRRDDLYKERGFRVSAIEVVAAAQRVPGVEAAAVVPPGDGEDGATLLVEGAVQPAHVLRGLRSQLDSAKVPARCVVVPALPLSVNGKVERRQLARLARTGYDQ